MGKLDNSHEVIINLCNYIKGEAEWSSFGLKSSNTRALVYNLFILNHKVLNGNQIGDQVKAIINRNLTDEENDKLCEIIRAWGEWRFILSKTHFDGFCFE